MSDMNKENVNHNEKSNDSSIENDKSIGNEAVLSGWEWKFNIFDKYNAYELGLRRALKNYNKELTVGQRFRINFNILAFVFSIIYYFCKGMWLKAVWYISLSSILNIVVCVIEIFRGSLLPGIVGNLPAILIAAICASYANYDYYLLKKKNVKMWRGLPPIFSNGIFAIAVAVVLIVIYGYLIGKYY